VKKLKDCGVFGVSSDEYLNYAMKNRQEFEDGGIEVYAMKNRQEFEDGGIEVVAELVEDTKAKLAAENVEAEAAPMMEFEL
jgi:hypothetical protein